MLTENRKSIILEIRNNPNVTFRELANLLKICITSVDKNIKYLKDNGYIKRVDNKRTGYWKAID